MAWMDWEREAEREVLEHILALLLALAGLADRASGLPAADRLQVLAVLGRGEAVARWFVIGTAFGTPAEAAVAGSPAAGDAQRLAASFRALALMLGVMLALAWCPARPLPGAAGAQSGSPMPPRRPAGPAVLPAPDTS